MDDESHQRPSLRLVAGGATPARREEESLVAAFLVGDDDAFGELVRRHEPMVLAIVRRYATTPDDARDLAQRTFLRAFEHARRSLRRGPPCPSAAGSCASP
jgi:RNA polymerase sigma-70 factor (ECF subfamily)